jgi:FlaG/FlaF family flagellin (archaellin)
MFALILALTVATWAQTSTQTTPSTPQQSTVPADKAKCACCDKMAAANAKDAPACCAHHDMKSDTKDKNGKETASCCAGKDAKSSGGKDGMSCMKSDKDQATAGCCKDACSKDSCGKDKTAAACCGEKCGKDGEKGCCSNKKTEKAAKNCCTKEPHS